MTLENGSFLIAWLVSYAKHATIHPGSSYFGNSLPEPFVGHNPTAEIATT